MASTAPGRAGRLDAAAAFMDRPSTSARQRAQFDAVVQDIPIYNTAENYSTDIERRIDAIRKIQKHLHTRHPKLTFNPIHVAYLMQLDLFTLTRLASDSLVANLEHRLSFVEPFVRACLGKDSHNDSEDVEDIEDIEDREDSVNENGKRVHAPKNMTEPNAKKTKTSANTLKVVSRNKAVSNKAKKRDGHSCVISKTEFPDSAHIIPYTVTKSRAHVLKAFDGIINLLLLHDERFANEIGAILFPRDTEEPNLGVDDRPCNIICLNPWFHRGFDLCMFGLKPVNLPPQPHPTDNTIEYISVEWRYLPKQLARALDQDHAKYLLQKPAQKQPVYHCQMNLDEITDLFQDHLQYPEGTEHGVQPFYDARGRLIDSGRRFDIPTYKKDSASTRRLLELAWLARCIASMSGAAECIDMLNDEPDFDWVQAATADSYRTAIRQTEENERVFLASYEAETDDEYESETGTESTGTAH